MMKALRARRKKQGLVRLDEWVTPELRLEIKQLIKRGLSDEKDRD